VYYTVSDETGVIMEASSICPDPQEQADFFGCPVHILKGRARGVDGESKRERR